MTKPEDLPGILEQHDRAFDLMFLHGFECGANLPWPQWDLANDQEREQIKAEALEKLKKELNDE